MDPLRANVQQSPPVEAQPSRPGDIFFTIESERQWSQEISQAAPSHYIHPQGVEVPPNVQDENVLRFIHSGEQALNNLPHESTQMRDVINELTWQSHQQFQSTEDTVRGDLVRLSEGIRKTFTEMQSSFTEALQRSTNHADTEVRGLLTYTAEALQPALERMDIRLGEHERQLTECCQRVGESEVRFEQAKEELARSRRAMNGMLVIDEGRRRAVDQATAVAASALDAVKALQEDLAKLRDQVEAKLLANREELRQARIQSHRKTDTVGSNGMARDKGKQTAGPSAAPPPIQSDRGPGGKGGNGGGRPPSYPNDDPDSSDDDHDHAPGRPRRAYGSTGRPVEFPTVNEDPALVTKVKEVWPRAMAFTDLDDHAERRRAYSPMLDNRDWILQDLDDPNVWEKLDKIQSTLWGDKSPYKDWPRRTANLFEGPFEMIRLEIQTSSPTWISVLWSTIQLLNAETRLDSAYDKLCEFSTQVGKTENPKDIALKLYTLALRVSPREASQAQVLMRIHKNLRKFTPEIYNFSREKCRPYEWDLNLWLRHFVQLLSCQDWKPTRREATTFTQLHAELTVNEPTETDSASERLFAQSEAQKGSCFRCGKPGHWSKDCKAPKQQQPALYNLQGTFRGNIERATSDYPPREKSSRERFPSKTDATQRPRRFNSGQGTRPPHRGSFKKPRAYLATEEKDETSSTRSKDERGGDANSEDIETSPRAREVALVWDVTKADDSQC